MPRGRKPVKPVLEHTGIFFCNDDRVTGTTGKLNNNTQQNLQTMINGNELAMPVEYEFIQYVALTIRQQFAAAAMQGLMASNYKGTVKEFAKASVQAADALIKELNKTEK